MSHAAEAAIPPMTIEAFRAWADRQPGRWELVDGQPRAMAPASVTHGLIQARAAYLLTRHLLDSGSPCLVATEAPVIPATLRRHNVRVPDLAVTCATVTADRWDLAAPTVILEILSPSNARATRDNLWASMTLPSLREILLLDATALRGELLARDAGGAWPEDAALLGPGDAVHLASIGFAAPFAAFYAGTAFRSG